MMAGRAWRRLRELQSDRDLAAEIRRARAKTGRLYGVLSVLDDDGRTVVADYRHGAEDIAEPDA